MKKEPIKNYIPASTSFASGFMMSGRGVDAEFSMEVDEKKAKKIVRKLLKEGRKIERAELGLDGDFACNSTQVYDGKKFHEYDACGGSLWATPILLVSFTDGPSETYECYTKKPR